MAITIDNLHKYHRYHRVVTYGIIAFLLILSVSIISLAKSVETAQIGENRSLASEREVKSPPGFDWSCFKKYCGQWTSKDDTKDSMKCFQKYCGQSKVTPTPILTPSPTPIPTLIPGPTPTITMTDGLVSYWTLDESQSEKGIAKDIIGTNNGTSHGTTIVMGKNGNARNFNGTTDYISIANNPSLDITGDFSISLWTLRNPTRDGILVSKMTDAANSGGFEVLHGNSGEVYCRTSDGTTYLDSYTSYGILDNNWHHIAVVKSGTSCAIYADGQDRTGVRQSNHIIQTNSLNVVIGSTSDLKRPYNGIIDEVRVYNRALSASEVTNLYTSGQ